jgi:nucleoside-diphosphate-sugar epimerase
MGQKKIILITGATGAQGNGVASALLRDGKFHVRCLTRNATSQKARELAAMGAEVVEGNLDDINSLRAAVDGCYGVFGVTNFWEHFEKEYQQGKNLINVVREKVVQHFVFSSLPDYKALSNGKFKGLDSNRSILPPMPWQNYVHLKDEDLRDIFAFLKSTKPVHNIVPSHIPPTNFQ